MEVGPVVGVDPPGYPGTVEVGVPGVVVGRRVDVGRGVGVREITGPGVAVATYTAVTPGGSCPG